VTCSQEMALLIDALEASDREAKAFERSIRVVQLVPYMAPEKVKLKPDRVALLLDDPQDALLCVICYLSNPKGAS
jgi:hypothetical protein